MSFADWLHEQGLGRYADEFARNDVDLEVAQLLNEADLEGLGLSLGHRKKFLAAAAALTRGAEPGSDDTSAIEIESDAERRQLTVMFCDLADSTRLAASMDPEELRHLIQSYQRICTAPVEKFGGYLAKFMGDGILVYFGYPNAHEDDAERAIRAALGILRDVETCAENACLKVRIGIATGLVVVGDLIGAGTARERNVIGEAPNLAARLQALAAPNQIVIGAGTRELAGELFNYEDLGVRELKGFPTPVRVWSVLGEGETVRRYVARGKLRHPLVGREDELALLSRRWTQALLAEGQILLLAGEPGIGKSRLADAFLERVSGGAHFRLDLQCSAHLTHTAFHPFIALLQRQLASPEAGRPAQQLAQTLDQWLVSNGLDDENARSLLAALLSLPTGPMPAMSPQRQKMLTIAALHCLVRRMAASSPLVIVIEDLHWADPTTLETIAGLIDAVAEARVMMILTCRLDFRSPWPNRAHVTTLTLNRLSKSESLALVSQMSSGVAASERARLRIAQRTDGIPLFIEELTRMLIETQQMDADDFSGTLVPATLRDSLMARLDRLGRVKELAQIGAVVGRSFDEQLLRAISGWPGKDLEDGLAALEAAELIIPGMDGIYRFTHALVQDTAYESLLLSRRREIHARLADQLEAASARGGVGEPEILAHHYAGADRPAQAVEYFWRAGEHAKSRSAMREASHHFRRGLEILALDRERGGGDEAELRLLISMGPTQQALEGLGSNAVEQIYLKAQALAEKLADKRQLFTVTWGLWLLHNQRGQLTTSYRLARELLPLAEEIGDDEYILQAYHAHWPVAFFHGDLARVSDYVALGIPCWDGVAEGSLKMQFGNHEPAPCALTFRSLARWLQGDDQGSSADFRQALDSAASLAHPFTTGLTLALANWNHVFRMEPDSLLTAAERLVALATEQGFAQWRAYGEIQKGWALAKLGNPVEGLALIDGGLATNRKLGGHVAEPFHLALRAEICLDTNAPDLALATLDEALGIAAGNGEHWWEPEILRLKARAMQLAGVGEPVQVVREALRMAQQIGARALELRIRDGNAI